MTVREYTREDPRDYTRAAVRVESEEGGDEPAGMLDAAGNAILDAAGNAILDAGG
jgi:hypothetical protein